GGRPLTCLNLLAFPANKLGPEILHGIIAGAAENPKKSGGTMGRGSAMY
ncbi:MAG: selenide, water dikinase SelD, partial [Firmicutes bacterium]|nr:selenide, water dikinase SelD [Bacillota bacterium]